MGKIPVFGICALHNVDNEDLIVSTLQSYLQSHARPVFPHRHSFYQILYVTKGGGHHIIDFESFPAVEGTAFFLAPGQIHEWNFTEETDGILVDIGSSLFATFLSDNQYLDQLLFFSRGGQYSTVLYNKKKQMADKLFQTILQEYNAREENYRTMIRGLLIQAFVMAERKIKELYQTKKVPQDFNQFVAFERLVEQHYTIKKLPKEYAELLYITPNYLNALCIKQTGRSAGDLIRSRVLLEAKRLLAHSPQSISQIAFQLNFENNSYFSRFFKKYENISPEEFRKRKMRK